MEKANEMCIEITELDNQTNLMTRILNFKNIQLFC